MPDSPAPIHSDVRRERRDANVRAILGFGIGLAVVAAAVHLGLQVLFEALSEREASDNPPQPQIARERPRFPRDLDRIPVPRLQEHAPLDMENLRRWEEQQLHEYAWVDPEAGTVRIPIDTMLHILADPRTAQSKGIVTRSARREEVKR
jgi:hypothetical protein